MTVRQFLRRRPGPLLGRDDPEAFVEFYDRYSREVLLFITRRVLDVDVAMDLLSETFTIALDKRDQFRGTTSEAERGWLYSIARNLVNHYYRDGVAERTATQRLAVRTPMMSVAEIERVEELADLGAVLPALANAVSALPADQAEAVRLRIVEELDYDEVASRLGISQDASRARVSRGLRALSRALRDDDVEEDAA